MGSLINTGDSARLDAVYESCVSKLSASYVKVCGLLDGGEVDSAASEFKSNFVPEVKRLSSELGKAAPRRYIRDMKWCSKVTDLRMLTDLAQKSLESGDEKTSRRDLKSIRNFFLYLHTGNRIKLSNDGIYTFKKWVGKIPDEGGLTEDRIEMLRIMKANIQMSVVAGRAKEDEAAFSDDLKEWSAEVENILKEKPSHSEHIAKLKTIANEFYQKYGIDLE